MVSVLTRIFGTHRLEIAEDVVQQTFIDAINIWKIKGVPENPSAWLFRVAKNKVVDIIRRDKHSMLYDFSEDDRILLTSEYTLATTLDHFFTDELVKDDLLRMMFACCHPGISPEAQITIILKTLCGFSTAEIAKAFITSEDTVSKRLYRTKEFFREQKIRLQIPSVKELKSRTHIVLNAIYLLFNEGYSASNADIPIRQELIDEGIMLCRLLAENKHTCFPEVYALMALICFHAARSKSRLTAEGEIILLPDQDRNLWDYIMIAEGNRYLDIAAFGHEISAYHIEAAIAFEHCIAPSFEQTNWKQILRLYDWLCKVSPSPVTSLNRIVALMQVHGADKALEAMQNIDDRQKLDSFYLYQALLGEIYSKLVKSIDAKLHF
jgi:RNA polymerase sigma factor (sigma-70 family)